jgi:putative spermidine/putrescine transport system ATP-binding protein
MRDGVVRQVGTPLELYAQPAYSDVAEFMGYRNLIRSSLSAAGSISIGGGAIQGTPIRPLSGGADVVVAVRPDDLRAASDGPLAITVESAQYHGRDFYCSGRTADATELYFVSAHQVQKGETVRLAADPTRVLIYPGTPS